MGLLILLAIWAVIFAGLGLFAWVMTRNWSAKSFHPGHLKAELNEKQVRRREQRLRRDRYQRLTSIAQQNAGFTQMQADYKQLRREGKEADAVRCVQDYQARFHARYAELEASDRMQ